MKTANILTTTAMAIVCTFAQSAMAGAGNPERRGIGSDPRFNQPLAADETLADEIDPLRSLAVTTLESMKHLSLRDVMDRIAQSRAGTVTGEELFRRWWNTNNKVSGSAFGADQISNDENIFCDSPQMPTNGFSIVCPRPEGQEAFNGSVDDYIAIGVTNRIDLAPSDGSDCGEQRLVFARESGQSNPINRNLIIFESHIPNPDPAAGLLGCAPIAEFWYSLSSDETTDENNNTVPLTPSKRGEMLKSFFFNGLPEHSIVAPVAAARYGGNAEKLGQIRSNQFSIQLLSGAPFIWTLREYKVNLGFHLRIQPVLAKTTPAPQLFAAKPNDPLASLAESLGDDLVKQLKDLASGNSDTIKFSTLSKGLDMAESDQNPNSRGNISFDFGQAPADGIILKKLQNEAIPNGLTPENIVMRVNAMTCSGCHQHVSGQEIGANLSWPDKSEDFVHISENKIVTSPNGDGDRFKISEAMLSENSNSGFLKARANVMERILNNLED